ncbi:hypothetical protein HPB48_021599 [Haemaphysalis longicornis]|uniref:Uncharacterized protein n=1 Tax=Haemaphysalis longicornis TaxID=44386 RepID=A0A9J6G9H8_HAELO|nr:hypothetical protein HPB48_021599 [Haemaphysalis longicornis]
MTAKSRVAPVKTLTLPQLLLLGAVLGARMSNSLEASRAKVPSNVETIFSKNSRITQHWITGNPSQWKQFVKNKVTEIHRLTARAQWRHCPGSCNPGYHLTRRVSLHILKTCERWWHGDTWLLNEPTDWPPEESQIGLKGVVEERE